MENIVKNGLQHLLTVYSIPLCSCKAFKLEASNAVAFTPVSAIFEKLELSYHVYARAVTDEGSTMSKASWVKSTFTLSFVECPCYVCHTLSISITNVRVTGYVN